ncbi:epoxide hydrolase [Microlunatus spumicola]|uniref:Epoxide hydrolase n=1 Tax=Microlunatus spumicola TaxID=81499 RepID=A0ABP6WJV5_9ACTN
MSTPDTGVGRLPEPHRPSTSDEAWEDLRRRLRATRWPPAPTGVGWSLGADPAYLRELVDHWADGFDWPAHEAGLNALPRYRVRLGAGDGLEVSYLHVPGVRAPGAPPPLPLLLAHGWPDSSWRFSKVLDLLTDPGAHGGDPADAFDLVVPDMPGHGHSPLPPEVELDTPAVAVLWAELMEVLGHRAYAVAGGDLGSAVCRYLALDRPERVVAVHRTDAGVPVFVGDRADLAPAERDFLDQAAAWGASEGAYAAMHRTKPLTAGAALTDSPAGLAAWVVEKLHAWSDLADGFDEVFSADEVLTLLTTTWFTGSITSSIRMYHANAAIPPALHARRVEVPSGFALYPADLLHPPREWLDRVANTVRVTHPARGGHFAPFERPEEYAHELQTFFRPYRQVS